MVETMRREWPNKIYREIESSKSKQRFNKAWKHLKNAWKGLREFWKWTLWGIKNIVDGTDEKLGEIIGERKSKITNVARRYLLRTLIGLSVAGYAWDKVVDYVWDSDKNKIEYVDENSIWANEDYFVKGYQLQNEVINGMHFRKDVWLTFYRVEKWDNLSSIREKISKIPEFSYLKNDIYGWDKSCRNIYSFNIPPKDLKPWLWIPIPMQKEKREVSLDDFRKYSKQAVNDMMNNEIYGEKIKTLVNKVGEKKVVDVMLAFALSESSENGKIWGVTFHRRENHFSAFSFSPFHILMEKCADKKTPGPWLKARQKLWLTEGQTYHPINAGKLFLAYWVEKMNWKDISPYFNITEKTKGKIWKKYNGLASYWDKLYNNYKKVSSKSKR